MKAIQTYLGAFILVLSPISEAHDNAELILASDGQIQGLPEHVQPTRLNMSERYFSVKGKVFSFPKCIDPYLSDTVINITGTWFHYPTDEPPHLTINFTATDKGALYSIPFSLLSAKPMHVIERNSTQGKREPGKKIAFDKQCQSDIDASVKVSSL